jgi:hypothetical protein
MAVPWKVKGKVTNWKYFETFGGGGAAFASILWQKWRFKYVNVDTDFYFHVHKVKHLGITRVVFFFIVYLTTLSVAQIITACSDRMISE